MAQYSISTESVEDISSWMDEMTDFNMSQNYTFYGTLSLGPEAIVIPTVFAVIFFIGVIGNGTLVRIVLMNPSMRSVPNVFIASLAVGDLLLLLVFVPFNALTYMTTGWPLGEPMCKIVNSVQVASTGVSVFTLTALSADRYHAIVNPMNKKGNNMMKRTYLKVIFIWCISLLLGVPTLVYSKLMNFVYDDGSEFQYCRAIPMNMELLDRLHIALMFVLLYLVPLIIISIYYALIAIKLIRSSKSVLGESLRNEHKQLRARKRVAKVVLVFVLIFGICWLPYHTFNMIISFSADKSRYENYGMMFFKSLGTIMAYANSCVNPLALYFLSNTFKSYYNKYIFCFLSNKEQRNGLVKSDFRDNSSFKRSPSRTLSRLTQRTMVYTV
ncbi:neuromedin-B receptor-like [Ptychodera flava]|uniref:neuromedin-B receptor-like n=1 Tax=Ptychodera flava TaxID=63121 RepID=UPI00396A48B3